MEEIVILVRKNSPRLNYVLDFIFKECWQKDYRIVFEISETQVHIDYGFLDLNEKSICIQSVPLLIEEDIHTVQLNMELWRNLPCFFTNSSTEVPFDIFAAIFYLLSRYEEYRNYQPDEFERFPYTLSIAYHHRFLHLPIIDYWLMEFKDILISKFGMTFPKQNFQFIPTYDIDIAYSYRGKGVLRNVGGFIKDAMCGYWSKTAQRFNVNLGLEKDPYDAYDHLDALHHTYALSPIYFFLLGSGKGLDKNLNPNGKLLQALIARIKNKYIIGIHPSYQSHESIEKLKQEVDILQVTKSRQHYIRFKLPDTYENLIKLGVAEDYSMGYGSINGFRAGTSKPFYWFNLATNQVTSLKIFPFSFMECNARFEQQQKPEEAWQELQQMTLAVKQVGGTMITIWHNFALGYDPEWEPWKKMYGNYLDWLYNLKS